MEVSVSNLNRRIHETKNSFGRSHRQKALMVEDDQLSHRPEDFRAQKQKNHQRAQIELPVGYLECTPRQGRSTASRDAKGTDPMGHKVDGEHSHSRPVNSMRSCRKVLPPGTALTENLERRDALHTVEEVRAQSAIGGAALTVTFLITEEEYGRTHQCEDGEEEEDDTDAEVDGGHEKKNQDRSQTGDDHLGQKLAEKNLQPLDVFTQRGQHVSGSALVELSRSHCEGMFENLSPEFNFDASRSLLANPISQKLQESAKHGASNNANDRQNEGGERMPQKNARDDEAGKGEPCQPRKHGAKSHGRSTQDTGSDTAGQPKQAFIEVHLFLHSVYSNTD